MIRCRCLQYIIEGSGERVYHAGDTLRYEASDNLMAVCLQHEIDHLHGVTMVDHLGPLKRASKMRELQEAIAAGARPGDTESDVQRDA